MNRKMALCFLLPLCLLLFGCSEKSMDSGQGVCKAIACCGGLERTEAVCSTAAHSGPDSLSLDTADHIVQAAEGINQTTSLALNEKQEDEFTPVELILQNPKLPNGCEVTSLAMVLSSAGFPVDHVELYRNYLPKDNFSYSSNRRFGPSPEEFYVGNAASRTGGWYCFENPIVEAGNAWIQQNGGSSGMQIISGLSQDDLTRYAQDGIPVIVWVTIGYVKPSYMDNFSWMLPNGELYVPYNNLHCVVLTGEENGQYQIADPIYGWKTVSKEVFWRSFDAMGRRAVTMQASTTQNCYPDLYHDTNTVFNF